MIKTISQLIDYISNLGLDEGTRSRLVSVVETEELTPKLLEDMAKILELRAKEADIDAKMAADRAVAYEEYAGKLDEIADEDEKDNRAIVDKALEDLEGMKTQLSEIIQKKGQTGGAQLAAVETPTEVMGTPAVSVEPAVSIDQPAAGTV